MSRTNNKRLRRENAALRAEIMKWQHRYDSLLSRLDDIENEAEYADAEAHRRAESCRRQRLHAERELQEAQDAARSREYRIRDITEKIERARSWGDSYSLERHLRELRNL